MIVHHQDVLGSSLGLGDQEGGIVHIGDAQGFDTGFDRGARESVVGDHQIGDDLVEHAEHRIGPVGVPRLATVGEHADAPPWSMNQS